MEPYELQKLIPILKVSNVSYFECGNLKIKFKGDNEEKSTVKVPEPKVLTTLPKEQMPQALEQSKADELMSFDQILNWSSGQKEGEIPLPLTGEEPIKPESQQV